MGRHRRSAAAPVAEDHEAGAADRQHGARRRKRVSMPLRTGLLGVSAAVAVGAVAVASGLLPGGDTTYTVSGDSAADQVRRGGAPDLLTQGGATAEPTGRTSASASAGADRSGERSKAPSRSASATPSRTPAATPSKQAERTERAERTTAPARTGAPERTKAPAPKTEKSPRPTADTPAPSRTPAAPTTSSAPPSPTATAPAPSTDATAQAAVLALVNQERAKVGCRALRASGPLNALAQNFSEDMAARGFFGHTDPDGDTPWDRAEQAGVEGLGGENIARGQADAQAVMDAWMNSDGHRANILNCDYTTLGVGMHSGPGGPWWTQDFGF